VSGPNVPKRFLPAFLRGLPARADRPLSALSDVHPFSHRRCTCKLQGSGEHAFRRGAARDGMRHSDNELARSAALRPELMSVDRPVLKRAMGGSLGFGKPIACAWAPLQRRKRFQTAFSARAGART
jgi:hypothetical protein